MELMKICYITNDHSTSRDYRICNDIIHQRRKIIKFNEHIYYPTIKVKTTRITGGFFIISE